MDPVSIDVDGSIDLVDRQRPKGKNGIDATRVRRSRLNDVMIVMERDRAELESALRDRLSRTVLAPTVDGLTLNLHQLAPEFHVVITPNAEQIVALATPEKRIALETEIAAEIFSSIQQRAANSKNPRWQPSVTATLRGNSKPVAEHSRPNSVWFKTLLWLLAAVILATAYLYLRYPAT